MCELPTFSQKMVCVMWEYWKLAVQGYQAYWDTPSFKSITLVRHICSRKKRNTKTDLEDSKEDSDCLKWRNEVQVHSQDKVMHNNCASKYHEMIQN